VRKLARFVLKYRRPIVAAWVVIFFAGIAGVGKSVDRLSTNFSLPGQPGYETATRVLHTYGSAADVAPYLLSISAPSGQRVDTVQSDLVFAAVQHAVPITRVIGHQQTGDPIFDSADGRTALAYAHPGAQRVYGRGPARVGDGTVRSCTDGDLGGGDRGGGPCDRW
jgi:RND superfamily putative drug exporter